MAELQKRDDEQAAAPEEDERLLGEEVSRLDFNMLCSTVAMQAQNGKWGKLNVDHIHEDENTVSEYGGGVHRMWEGELLHDCFDDRCIALQSSCCPCYRFGKNMTRAGFGSCLLQGSIHLILVLLALSNLLAFTITGSCLFLYLAIFFALSVGTYLGYFRMQIKKKFNINCVRRSVSFDSHMLIAGLPVQGGETPLDDCVSHLICPYCTLCQESRTLEMNNVQDGIWHGRGDTICVGDSKPYLELTPPCVVYTHSPQLLTMQNTSSNQFLLPV